MTCRTRNCFIPGLYKLFGSEPQCISQRPLLSHHHTGQLHGRHMSPGPGKQEVISTQDFFVKKRYIKHIYESRVSARRCEIHHMNILELLLSEVLRVQ